MKKKIMKAGILIVVFCAAVIISSLVINKDVSDEAADMGAASLPEISVSPSWPGAWSWTGHG